MTRTRSPRVLQLFTLTCVLKLFLHMVWHQTQRSNRWVCTQVARSRRLVLKEQQAVVQVLRWLVQ